MEFYSISILVGDQEGRLEWALEQTWQEKTTGTHFSIVDMLQEYVHTASWNQHGLRESLSVPHVKCPTWHIYYTVHTEILRIEKNREVTSRKARNL